MALTWESLYSFFSPPALRTSSPQGASSLFSSPFSKSTSAETTPSPTSQTDLPMPPTSAFGAAATSATIPSPADSSASLAAGGPDYFSANSPYTNRNHSLSTDSTASTTPSTTPSEMETVTAVAPNTTAASAASTKTERPAAPRRSATDVVALEPMSRDYPKPAHEPSVDELLARAPGKWAVGHYVKNPRERNLPKPVASEESARQFEKVKRDLMRAKEELEAVARR